ncbi:hypothetical protein BX600DRAFT_452179, partial [Xylariales sp. PMI_506]
WRFAMLKTVLFDSKPAPRLSCPKNVWLSHRFNSKASRVLYGEIIQIGGLCWE